MGTEPKGGKGDRAEPKGGKGDRAYGGRKWGQSLRGERGTEPKGGKGDRA